MAALHEQPCQLDGLVRRDASGHGERDHAAAVLARRHAALLLIRPLDRLFTAD